MKCQKCGKSEASFHYSSNINGQVTEAHLCEECAAQSGYDVQESFSLDRLYDMFFPIMGGFGSFPAASLHAGRANTGFPLIMQLQPATQLQNGSYACGCQPCKTGVSDVQVDDEMSKRRELNVLHEQMRLAASTDDFEKAIELREKIKEIEKAGGV